MENSTTYSILTTQNLSQILEEGGSATNSSGIVLDACPQYQDHIYRIVGTVLCLFILVIGVIGNILVVFVVSKTKSLRSHPTNWYLTSVALADITLLFSAVLPTIVEYQLRVNEWVFGGRIGCSIAIFLQYLGVNASALSITAFSVERYVAVCHPLHAHAICTVSRAKRIICCLWGFGVCYSMPWLFLTKTVTMNFRNGESFEQCTFALKRVHYTAYYMCDLVVFYALPLIGTCVLYSLIVRTLRKKDCQGPEVGKVMARRQLECVVSVNKMAESNRVRTAQMNKHQIIRMLVVVVIAFAVLWLPYRAFVVYNSFAKVRWENIYFLLFCRSCVYANSAINPILYNAMSVKFRNAFLKMLKIDKRQFGIPEFSKYSESLNTRSTILRSQRIPVFKALPN